MRFGLCQPVILLRLGLTRHSLESNQYLLTVGVDLLAVRVWGLVLTEAEGLALGPGAVGEPLDGGGLGEGLGEALSGVAVGEVAVG